MIQTLAALLVAVGLLACGGSSSRSTVPSGDPLGDVEGEELFQQGLALANGGDFVRAEQYLTAAMARGVPEERVLPALIRVCVASSRLRAALSHAEPYLQRTPSAWSLRFLVASMYIGLGEIERGRAELERVVVDAPDQPDAYYLLGLLLRDEVGDRRAAANRFASYLELAPDGEHAAEVGAALRGLRSVPPADAHGDDGDSAADDSAADDSARATESPAEGAATARPQRLGPGGLPSSPDGAGTRAERTGPSEPASPPEDTP